MKSVKDSNGCSAKSRTGFAKALPGIIERAAGQQLTTADLYELAEFMSLQWVRVLHFRKRVQKVESELWNRLLKKLGSLGSLHDWAAAEGMLDEHIDQMERLTPVRSLHNSHHR